MCVALPCVECVCVFVSSSGRYVLELVALFYRMPLEFMYMYYVYAVCVVTWHMMCISICVSVCVCVFMYAKHVCVCVYLWAQQVNCLTNSLEVLLLRYPLMSGDTQDWMFIPFHSITANVHVLYWLSLCSGS